MMKNLKPRYIGPYYIMERIGSMSYRLALRSELGVIHDAFHVFVLRKVIREPELIISELQRTWDRTSWCKDNL